MLIKKSIVEKWYQRDSWVYKNFSYLFSNPLWKKRVPYGFSVCPYFWLSLFSFFIFRPVVVAPIIFGILPIIKLIGWPAEKFDRFLFKKFFKGDDRDYTPGVATLAPFAFLMGAVMILAFVAKGSVYAYTLWTYVAGPETGSTIGRFSYWSALTFLAMWLVIGVHKGVTKSECKTHYYIFPWLLLFIVSSFIVIPTEMLHGIGIFLASIWGFIVGACSVIWWGLSSSVILLASAIWTAIKFAPLFGMSWVLLLVYITIIGYVINKLVNYMDYLEKKNIGKGLSEAERIAQNRTAWLHLFYRVLMQGDHWKKHYYLDEELRSYDSQRMALRTYEYEILFAGLAKYLSSKLDELQATYPLPDMSKWEDAMGMGVHRWGELGDITNNPLAKFYFDNVQFKATLKEVVATGELGEKIKAQKEYYDSIAAQKEEKKTSRKESWSHQMCLKVTAKIGIVSENLWDITKDIFINIGVFFAYMWTLVKAKKKGVCPYIVFSDPQPAVAPTNTVDGK
jgi:hypothetical protein